MTDAPRKRCLHLPSLLLGVLLGALGTFGVLALGPCDPKPVPVDGQGDKPVGQP